MTDVIATSQPGPTMRALAVASTTTAVVTLTAIFMFSWLSQFVDMTNVAPLPSIAIGLSMAFIVLAMPATGWGWTVARLAGQPAWPIIRTTIRGALPTFAVVGIVVDSSQFIIDYVWHWHRLAVHGLFAISFAVGMAVFLGVVTWRVARVIIKDGGDGTVPTPRRIGQRVALATAAGVIAGAVLALPLDWAVVTGMGRRMLAPLYLVLAIGTFAGGFVFGQWLARLDPPSSQRGVSNPGSNRSMPELLGKQRSWMNPVGRLAILALAGAIYMTFASIPDGPIPLMVAILVIAIGFAWKVTDNFWAAVARGAAGGAIAGVLILAPGWRVAMRIVSLMEPSNETVFTISGTLGILVGVGVLVGGVMGIIGVLVGLATESGSRLVLGTLLGVIVTGFLVVHSGLREMVHEGGGMWVNLLIFGVVAIPYGMVAMAVAHRIGRKQTTVAGRQQLPLRDRG